MTPNILCVLRSGGDFDRQWVLNLRNAIKKNLPVFHRFICLNDIYREEVFDEKTGIQWIPLEHSWPKHWSKAEIFRPDLHKFERLWFFDLDCVITGDLSEMAQYDGDACITQGFMNKSPSQSLFNYRPELTKPIWDEFTKRPEYWMDRGRPGFTPYHWDQLLLNEIDHGIKFDFYQDKYPGQLQSYKFHVQKEGLGDNARVVMFHGKPRPNEINGELYKLWCGADEPQSYLDEDSPILITGAARSGTSMISGLLNLCGAWKGETVPGGKENVKGFFENSRLREGVNKALLNQMGMDPLGVRELPEREDVEALPDIRDMVDGCIGKDGYKDGPWLFKDAKMALLWPAWRKAYPDAKWIIVRRDEREIARSCIQTGFMAQHSVDPVFWGELIQKYLDRLENLAQTGVWFREIWPTKIMNGDWSEFRKLCKDLGLRFDRKACEEFIVPSAWNESPDGQVPLWTSVHLNTDHEKVRNNIRNALDQGHKYLVPTNKTHDEEMVIVGGGPSLQKSIGVLRKLYKKGAKIVATNATHDWLIDHKFIPWGMAMMDARPHNAKFVEKARDDVIYFMASQCDPGVFEKLKEKQVVIWHKFGNLGEKDILIEKGFDWHPIFTGGSTIGMTLPNLGFGMGFRKFHFFGMDSCLIEGKHHAYEQTWNDGELVIPVFVGDREFQCTVWMARQAEDFQKLCEHFGDMMNITIHGEGLLTAIVKEAARIHEEKEDAGQTENSSPGGQGGSPGGDDQEIAAQA